MRHGEGAAVRLGQRLIVRDHPAPLRGDFVPTSEVGMGSRNCGEGHARSATAKEGCPSREGLAGLLSGSVPSGKLRRISITRLFTAAEAATRQLNLLAHMRATLRGGMIRPLIPISQGGQTCHLSAARSTAA